MENPRVSRRKEILKIRAEINAKETKETVAKINKAKKVIQIRLFIVLFSCVCNHSITIVVVFKKYNNSNISYQLCQYCYELSC